MPILIDIDDPNEYKVNLVEFLNCADKARGRPIHSFTGVSISLAIADFDEPIDQHISRCWTAACGQLLQFNNMQEFGLDGKIIALLTPGQITELFATLGMCKKLRILKPNFISLLIHWLDVEQITALMQGINSVAQLDEISPVLFNCDKANRAQLDAFNTPLNNIRKIKLDGSVTLYFRDHVEDLLPRLPNLQNVSLYIGVNIVAEMLTRLRRFFVACPGITHLEISIANIAQQTPENIQALFQTLTLCTNLQELTLQRVKFAQIVVPAWVRNETFAIYDIIANFTQLRVLHLGDFDCDLTSIVSDEFSLDSTQIRQAYIRGLGKIARANPHLEVLKIPNGNFERYTATEWELFGNEVCAQASNLRELDLSDNPRLGSGFEFSGVGVAEDLRLKTIHTTIRQFGAALSKCPKLTRLNLANAGLGYIKKEFWPRLSISIISLKLLHIAIGNNFRGSTIQYNGYNLQAAFELQACLNAFAVIESIKSISVTEAVSTHHNLYPFIQALRQFGDLRSLDLTKVAYVNPHPTVADYVSSYIEETNRELITSLAELPKLRYVYGLDSALGLGLPTAPLLFNPLPNFVSFNNRATILRQCASGLHLMNYRDSSKTEELPRTAKELIFLFVFGFPAPVVKYLLDLYEANPNALVKYDPAVPAHSLPRQAIRYMEITWRYGKDTTTAAVTDVSATPLASTASTEPAPRASGCLAGFFTRLSSW